MTPDEQRTCAAWDMMTYPMRRRFVSTVFAAAGPDDMVWHTQESYSGYDGWWFVRWECVCD
jgi:hypothetical protein